DPHMRWHKSIGVRSYAAIPILSNGQLMGVFCASSNLSLEDSTSSLLSTISDRIGMAMENALLYSRLREVATVETRQKLARDLHDSVTQSLYSLVLMAASTTKLLESGENLEEVKRSTERVGEVAHQTLKEMRLLLYELRPLKLEQDGLVNALRQRVDTVENRSGIKVRTKIGDLPPLPLIVEEHLYHIALEALNNILKHSGSPDAALELYAENGNITLKVSDHGKGFDVKKTMAGMGLADIRERVRILGGKLSIDARPGSGTRLCVKIKNMKNRQDFAERMSMYENPNSSGG
ncbi:MAG TPA: sensor histidine kinase, partial [Anaerolineales bacterium]|nr:sensor histidine kinase [Anaerolineales bacterium]